MKDNHVWCELCRGYARDQTAYDAHYKEKHEPAKKPPMKVSQREPTPTPEPSNKPTQEPDKEPVEEPTPEPKPGQVSQSVISTGAATSETNCEGRPFKCKHCDKAFKNAPQRNMHINRIHRIHKCTDCDKRFITEEGRDHHRADVHKHPRFHCEVKRCEVYAHNLEELHRHRQDIHWSMFPFRCNLCPYVLGTRENFERHQEKMHGILASKYDGSVKYKCTKCVREYRSVSMFINHSREHDENIHQCSECNWCFAMLNRLHVHCKSTHDTMHNACDTCETDFPNNQELFHHVRNDHVNLCHICRTNFVSSSQLQDHLDEAHAQARARFREQMIDDERAKEREEKARRKEERKKKKKRKKKDEDDDDDDDEDDDSTYYPSQDQGDDSNLDSEWLPSRRALKRADEEGDH